MAVLVSIILPTYNRARFLPEALAAIGNQTFSGWELIVVDDGSTDNTQELVAEVAKSTAQPVRYMYQENQGAYGARNTGLDHAAGKYIAFYDSDDIWLPHHLADCVEALEANPEVDWVYGACRMVEYASGRMLCKNTFYENGRPRPFMSLNTKDAGNLQIINDRRAIERMVSGSGLMSGLQNSVIRRCVFAAARFATHFRNEAEDQLFVIQALASGHVFAYFTSVHVDYFVHESNSSGSAQAMKADGRQNLFAALVRGYEELPQRVKLDKAERRALRKRLCAECFWHLGYAILWNAGSRQEALRTYRRGLRYWPWDWRCWKTYSIALFRVRFNLAN